MCKLCVIALDYYCNKHIFMSYFFVLRVPVLFPQYHSTGFPLPAKLAAGVS